MLRLNRTTEYGLIALRYMSKKKSELNDSHSSAREIADVFRLPFEITAKTLQRLKECGLIDSTHGARGGYVLKKPLGQIKLSEFLQIMEGGANLVQCSDHQGNSTAGVQQPCEYQSLCEIQHAMSGIQARFWQFLSTIHLDEFAMTLPNIRKPEPQAVFYGEEP